MFDLQDTSPEKGEAFTGLDKLRGVIVSSAKVYLLISDHLTGCIQHQILSSTLKAIKDKASKNG